MLRVLVVDDDRNISKMLDFALQKAGFSVMTASDGTTGLDMATQHPPDVAVLDVMMPGLHGYELCRRLRVDPRTAHAKIVFLTARSQPIDEQEALKAGADMFLSKPVVPSDLIAKIQALLADEPPSAPAPPEPEPVAAPKPSTAPAPTPEPKGRLIVCYSPSPGVGVTTLAVNLALAFSFARHAKTPMVELHATPGNTLSALGLSSRPPIGDLTATGKDVTWDTLSLHLVDHSSGVCVLPAPPPESDMSPALTGKAISILCKEFPLVVADAASVPDDRVQSMLLVADLVLLVLTPEVPVIRSALESLQEISALQSFEGQIAFVVNNVRPKGTVPVERIREGVKRPVLAIIPYEPKAPASHQAGQPLLLVHPRSPASQAVGRLAVQLVRGFNLASAP